MYTISDVVEMGDARELLLSLLKDIFQQDDSEQHTAELEEYFDE